MTSELIKKPPIVSPLRQDTPVLLVLLGASNLSRGCFTFSKHMKECLHPRSTEVLIASGPGRAYYASGGMLNVTYPPIYINNIFEVAQSKSESGYQVIALATDIGNDIMYGVSVEQLIETVRQIFERLQSMNAEIFYTTLPVTFEKKDHLIRFRILRSLLFPHSAITYDEAVAGIIEVNRFLRECRYGHLISDMNQYLGFDAIHYGWLRAHAAWSQVAKAMLGTLGVTMTHEITLAGMVRSYWEEFRQVVGSDMMGFKKNNPEHF